MSKAALLRDGLPRSVAIIVVSTMLLTTAFLGVVVIAFQGGNPGISGRVPLYLLLAAAVFVTFIVLLEHRDLDGQTVLVSTTSIALTTGAIAWLVGEGLVFAIEHTSLVLNSDIIVYLVAAAVACTGLFYWTLNHWREFTV